MKKILSLIILSCMAFYVFAGHQATEKPIIPGVQNLYEIQTPEGLIYSSSQPSEESLSHLKQLKIKSVVNLRMPGEADQIPAENYKNLKVRYITLPVHVKQLSMKEIKTFNEILANPKNYPLFIHCSSGNRVAMMLAFNNIFSNKMTVQQAIAKAKKEGLTSELIQNFIKKFIEEN